MYDTVTAKHHVELMEALHSSCISRSVSESVMFKNKSFYTKKYKEGRMEIKVTNGDVISSILGATHRGKVCVINPGSYKTPGGKEETYYSSNREFTNSNGVAGMAEDENHASLLSRVDFMLCIAEHMGVKNLILCDYGCSLYHQDPCEVAEIFKSQFNKHNSFDYVEFSIVGSGNYKIFEEVLR